MPRHSSAGPSQRQLRIGEQIKHIVAEVLRRGHFRSAALFDSSAVVTVTEVRVSPDIKNATAYVIGLGDADIDAIIPALNDEASTFQKEIGRQITTKFTPRVRFVRDESFEYGSRIDEILRDIKRDS